MKIADISIKRPVTITMIMLALTLIGVVAMTSLPLDLYPKLDLPIASVVTTLPGAAPAEIEQQVTKPIEDALKGLAGVSEIDSTSLPNTSQVVVQFNYGVNMSDQMENMRSIVNRVKRSLPDDATDPVVQQFDPNSQPIMTVVLAGGTSLADISDLAENIIYPALQHVNGVGSVDMIGNLTRQITVEVDPGKLNYYNLSVQQVLAAISADNFSADVGQINRGSQLIPLHINGQFASIDEILKVPIQVGKKAITVGDVAKVVDGNKDVSLIATLNTKPSIGFSIKQTSDGNTVKVSDNVQKELANLSRQLPQGVRLITVSDSAQTIRESIRVVSEHTLFGFVLGILVMLCILRNVRTTVVIAIAIPISVLSTFILMYLNKLTINTITLGSLGIALGSLVDFSVVVLESIFRARQSGLGPMEAASVGTKEVGTAVMVAAFAQICVFGPSLFTSGIAGQIFVPMALTVTFSHIVALIVALTLTPMMASRLLTGPKFSEEERIPGVNAPFRIWAPFDWFGKGMHILNERYRKFLSWGLKHRKTVVIVSVAMFFGSIPLLPLIGTELMSSIDSNQVNVSITLANGTRLEETAKVVQDIQKRISTNIPNVTSMYAQIGSGAGGGLSSSNSNSASLIISLGENGPKTPAEIAVDIGHYLDNIPGAKIVASPASAMRGPGGQQVQVVIQGPDLNTLRLLSDQVTKIMRGIPELKYVDNQLATGNPSYNLNISHEALAQYGLTQAQVVNALHTAFLGSSAARFYQGDNQYDIVVRFPEDYSRDITNLSQITVVNNAGEAIPLDQLATITIAQEPARISHMGGTRSVQVQANVAGISSGEAQAKLRQELAKIHVPKGYSVGFGSFARFQSDAFRSLGIGLVASVVLVYMVMASMFESLLTPFVIMFSLPPTFVGAILGLFITHKTLNMNSLMGMIMLIGLVTNNAIVLVDYTNQWREKGMTLAEALMHAGPVRLRPILLTTLTNVLAMLPLLIFGGTGAATLSSMAAVITFGLTLSTLVTLILVPVMYVIMDNRINRFRRKRIQASAHPVSAG